MNKKHLSLAVFLLATAILTSGCFLKKSDKQPEAESNNNQNQVQDTNQADDVNPSGSYSTNELFAMNKPMKCEWIENATDGREVTNLLFIDGKKFYQDVNISGLGHAFTVSDAKYLYIWNDFNATASKMKFPEPDETAQADDSANLEQKREFVCEKWSVDNSFFIPPQDINFKDVTEEMNQAVEDMGDELGSPCDACASAPTPDMVEVCRQNLNCD